MVDKIIPASPLVIGSDDGLLLFPSLEAARGYLEVPDVEAGVYGPAFDAEGRRLIVEAPAELFEARPRGSLQRLRWRILREFNAVEVRVAEDQPTHQPQLIELLASALGETTPNANDGTGRSDLDYLLTRALARYGIT